MDYIYISDNCIPLVIIIFSDLMNCYGCSEGIYIYICDELFTDRINLYKVVPHPSCKWVINPLTIDISPTKTIVKLEL